MDREPHLHEDDIDVVDGVGMRKVICNENGEWLWLKCCRNI